MNTSDATATFEQLESIANIRRLRAALEPFAVSPAVNRISRITPHQHATLFDLLHEIDRLFPGGPILRPEETQ